MDNNLEFYILVFSLKDELFLTTYGEYLFSDDVKGRREKTYFTSKIYQIIFDIIYSTFVKLEKLPAEKSVSFLINGLFKNDSRKEELLIELNDICSFDEEFDYEIIKEETEKFIKERKFIESLNNSQGDLQAQDYTSVVERMTKAINISFDEDLGLDIKDYEAVKRAVKIQNSDTSIVPTGYAFLDDKRILSGGLRPGEMGVVAANSGIGKTMFLCNLAVNNLLDGKTVVYVSFETSTTRLMLRILANILGMKSGDIADALSDLNPSAEDDIKEFYLNLINKFPGTLIIKEYEANEKSSADIIGFLGNLKKSKNIVPDALYLDYLLIMSTNNKRADRGNSYGYFKTVAEEVRNIGKRKNCVVWTACQINREGLADSDNGKGGTKAIITSRSLSDSSGIEHTSDLLLTLSQTAVQKEKGELTCFVAKNRNGNKGVIFKLRQDESTCKISQRRS